MVEVNLLPWRDYTRAYQRKQIKVILFLTVVLSVLPLMGAFIFLSQQEKKRHLHVLQLKQEVARYGKTRMLPKAGALRRGENKKIISQQHRTQQLFHALAFIKEENLCFTNMTRVKETIVFTGIARSALDLTLFLTHWRGVSLFSEVKIEQIEQQKNQVRFHLRAVS